MICLEGDEHCAGGRSGQASRDHQSNSSRGISFTIKKNAEHNAQQPNAKRPQPRGNIDNGKIANRFPIDNGHLPAYTLAGSLASEDSQQ
jgi:hypothetical protein